MNLKTYQEVLSVAKAKVLEGASVDEVRDVFFEARVLVTNETLDLFIQQTIAG